MNAVFDLDAGTNPHTRKWCGDIGVQGIPSYFQDDGSFDYPVVDNKHNSDDRTGFESYRGLLGQVHQLPSGVALNIDLEKVHYLDANLNSIVSIPMLPAETFLPWLYLVGYAARTSWLETFSDIVANWRRHLTDRHYKGLLARLEFLFDEDVEISEKQQAPDVDSFSALIAYISANPDFKTPSVSYNKDGSFEATWVGDTKLRLAVSFIGLKMVRWLYLDARSGIESATTGAGTVPTLMLANILRSYQTLEWIRG